jgi:Sec-independent protein secretion pathway component TatC
MKKLNRWILVVVFLVAAIASYSAGSSTGVFVFVILGFLFECGFWFKLLPSKKKTN